MRACGERFRRGRRSGHWGGESRARAGGVGSLSLQVAGGLVFPAGSGRPTWEGLWAGVWAGGAPLGGTGSPASCPGGAGPAWVTCSARVGAALPGEAGSDDAGAQVSEEDWPGANSQPRLDGAGGRSRDGSAASGPRAPGRVGRAWRGHTSPGCVRRPLAHLGASRWCRPPPGALPEYGVAPTGQSTFPRPP